MHNPLKQKLDSKKVCVNGFLTIPSGYSAELMAQAEFDSLTVDLQHGVHDYFSMVECFRAIKPYGITPIARVPQNDPSIIGKVLDAGAYGVICPMVNNRRDAEQLVKSCWYPPEGDRSFGPVLAARYGQTDGYLQSANREILIFPMIETREAVKNLEEILDVPGISGPYIGPSDLALSLGKEVRLDSQDPEILSIYRKAVYAAQQRNLVAAMHNLSSDYAVQMVEMGFQFVTVGNDSRLLATGAREIVMGTRTASGAIAV